jgi:DNA modification methylase
MPIVEYIFWITKEHKTPKFNKETFRYTEVWSIPPVINPNHPATFPNLLVEQCIVATTDIGDLVLDPFLGSGTVSEVARKIKRSFIGIEINPEYCEVAEERLAQGVL